MGINLLGDQCGYQRLPEFRKRCPWTRQSHAARSLCNAPLFPVADQFSATSLLYSLPPPFSLHSSSALLLPEQPPVVDGARSKLRDVVRLKAAKAKVGLVGFRAPLEVGAEGENSELYLFVLCDELEKEREREYF